MNKEEVLKLAKLARIELPEGEAEALSHEFETILSYVGEIKNAKLKPKAVSKKDFPLKNIMREDEDPHESGIHSDTLLKSAPKSKNGFVAVKKILG